MKTRLIEGAVLLVAFIALGTATAFLGARAQTRVKDPRQKKRYWMLTMLPSLFIVVAAECYILFAHPDRANLWGSIIGGWTAGFCGFSSFFHSRLSKRKQQTPNQPSEPTA